MTPLDPPMSVCYDCSRSTSGRCWRHRNVDLVNFRPASPPTVRVELVARIEAVMQGELDRLSAALAAIDSKLRTVYSVEHDGFLLSPDDTRAAIRDVFLILGYIDPASTSETSS